MAPFELAQSYALTWFISYWEVNKKNELYNKNAI